MKRALACLILVLPLAISMPICAQQQKVIKDKAEFDAYMAALKAPAPGEQAALMEAFIAKYPGSVMKSEALEYAMSGYQQVGNMAKAEAVATQIASANPDHIAALLIIAYAKRSRASQQTDRNQALALASEAQAAAEHALEVLPKAAPPEGVTPAEFAQRRAQMTPILHGIAGFGLLQKKDYQNARVHYLKSDLSDLQNAFQIAICELETNPIDISGFWHAVKAAQLAESQHNEAGVSQITGYAKAKYKKYHGSTDGWDDFVLKSRPQSELPSQASLALVVLRAPTPCEIAVEALDQNTPESLGFADREFILERRDCSAANKIAADRVWLAIMIEQKQGAASLKLPGVKVIAATKDALDVAITDDNQAANKADLHVTLEHPMAKLPAVGSKVDVIGVITGYTPEPFMFRMERGEVTPATPAK